MGFLGNVFNFLTDGSHWHGQEGIPTLTLQHLQLTVVSVFVAGVVALPIGLVLGHVRTGGAIAVNIANIGRALPALALLILAVQWVGIGDPTGILTPVQSVPAVHRDVRRWPCRRCSPTRTSASPESTTRSANRHAAWA